MERRCTIFSTLHNKGVYRTRHVEDPHPRGTEVEENGELAGTHRTNLTGENEIAFV